MFAQIFSLSSLLVMPFWLLMIALPHWRWTKRIAGSLWIVAPAALLYALLVLPQLATALPLLMNPTLDGIAGLLGTPAGATIGWVHFLAFDLFVGAWEVRTARREGIPHLLVLPCLVLTFLFGPIGLLAFLGLRLVHGRFATIPATGAS